MGLVNTVALDVEFLRDCDTGETHLRCACGEWWDVTPDFGRLHVANAVIAALQHYSGHDAEHTTAVCPAHGEHPHAFERRTDAEVSTVAMKCLDCPICMCPNAAYGEHGTRSACVLCGWRLP